jgi:methyl-accepting chemotaxis protein
MQTFSNLSLAQFSPTKRVMFVVALVAGAAIAWHGSWWALVGCALVLVGALGILPGAATQAQPDGKSDFDRANHLNLSSDSGDTLANQIIPVWARQMEATNQTIHEGMALLLGAFSGMSDGLEAMLADSQKKTGTQCLHEINSVLEQCQLPLNALREVSHRALKERDDMLMCLKECVAAVSRLHKLGERALEVSRHTKLVAFNASIEANRQATGTNDGARTIAQEIKALSEQLNQIGRDMLKDLCLLETKMNRTHVEASAQQMGEDEFKQEVDLSARMALLALLHALGQANPLNEAMLRSCSELRETLDDAFVHFQVGDRVNQMLQIIAEDMKRFVELTPGLEGASASTAREWLDALESRYTMEEQRSHHHGNVHVDCDNNVEFF